MLGWFQGKNAGSEEPCRAKLLSLCWPGSRAEEEGVKHLTRTPLGSGTHDPPRQTHPAVCFTNSLGGSQVNRVDSPLQPSQSP